MPDYKGLLVHHDLKSVRPKNVRLLIAQFTTSHEEWGQKDGLYFQKNINSVWSNIDKLLTTARQYTVDMVIFPELSVPSQCISGIQSWSRETGATVIAGSHYHKIDANYISRSPIIVAGEVFFTEKITPAPIEISPFEGDGIVSGKEIALIRNSPIGNFGVLICSDYLKPDVRRLLIEENIDILCVPAVQNKSELYYSRMDIDCEESENGIYIVYSNMQYDTFGDGRSAFFGKMDKLFLEKIKDKSYTDMNPFHKVFEMKSDQNFVVLEVDLDHKRPYINRTVDSCPNIYFIKTEIATDSLSTQFLKNIAHDDERYKRILDLFVPPVEYKAILSKLEKHKLVFIVGDPGIGKTYSAARILRHYFDIGYKPIWYTGLEKEERLIQRQVLEQFEPKNKEVIYFEDPFGRTAFEKRDAIYQIFGPLVDRLVDIDARIIITSRREIFERFTQESLTSKDYEKFKEEMSVIKPSYDSSALIEIMKRIASNKCKWFLNNTCILEVEKAIRKNDLSTPLSIRDLVFATENVTSPKILKETIDRRKHETTITFAIELQSATPTTKLALILVYLFGFGEQILLVQLFNRVSAMLKLVEGAGGTVTFMQEIRPQMGYRIEQFGSVRYGLRFTHPIYEESITEVAQKDSITEELITTVVKVVARDDVHTVFKSLSRNATKYPELTAKLFGNLVEVLREQGDFKWVVRVGLHIVAVYDETRHEDFLKLIEDLYSYSELVQFINYAQNVYTINDALRLAYNYQRVFKKSQLSDQSEIDWPTLLLKLKVSANFDAVLSTLERAKLMEPDIVNEFIQTIPWGTLRRKCANSPEQMLKIFKDTEIYAQLVEFFDEIVGAKNIIKRGNLKWQREFLLDFTKPNVAIIVDDGAVEAIRHHYNLLPPGVVDVIGIFKQGDIITIKNQNDQKVGVGVIEYDSEDIRNIRGHNSSQIPEITGSYFGPYVMRQRSIYL